MYTLSSPETIAFHLEGRFLGFATEPGDYKLKFLRLATPTGEYFIKLPKDDRSKLYRHLNPGDWVQASGTRKFKAKTGEVKWKADEIRVAVPHPDHRTTSQAVQPHSWKERSPSSPVPIPFQPSSSTPTQPKKSETILVCQKSDCCKLGGKAVTTALQKALAEKGLDHQVQIKGTGCMKQCKAGPNIVMPDKTRYTRIRPESVSALVDRHFT
ncbi:MAG: NAD(P)H-dependent oxidoreductase subunit E [Oculatellaceae cyanobacterium Prado106]|jgi:(2Fe-2S) ferredoxin|nr:NAD(P)H-dependent oxidoreductase subunit E [Oculatellaceae cyanobacterium Prado106]